MNRYSTNEAGKLLGITGTSLVRYMKAGKIPLPEIVKAGRSKVHSWTEADIEKVRKLLSKIANGRKTRYQKLRETQGTQPRAAALHKKRKPTKKKK
jgi:predicted DNA-binding transcriptional regulator AlpA